MKAMTGIFASTSAAERAASRLAQIGVPRARIRQLTPYTPERQIHTIVPIAETEQPGMGKAIGAVVGFVLGAMVAFVVFGALRGGLTEFSPAILIGAAALGAMGAIAGAFAGGALEARMFPGLPKDELYLYEDALCAGRSVVFALTGDSAQEAAARRALQEAGAESLDAREQSWRVGLSPASTHAREQQKRAG